MNYSISKDKLMKNLTTLHFVRQLATSSYMMLYCLSLYMCVKYIAVSEMAAMAWCVSNFHKKDNDLFTFQQKPFQMSVAS